MENTICLFGDSIAKGVTWDAGHQRYSLLKESFAEKLKASGEISITNCAKFGCTISKGMDLILQRKEKLKKYQYIALEFGGNDCDFDWQAISEHPEKQYQPKTPLKLFIKEYRETVRAIQAAGGKPVLLTLPPIDPQRYFTWISRNRNEKALLQWLGDVEHIYRWHEMYTMAVCQVAREEEVPLVDITTRFLEMNLYQSCICEDGIHLNEKGHQIVYEELLQYIQSHTTWLSVAV